MQALEATCCGTTYSRKASGIQSRERTVPIFRRSLKTASMHLRPRQLVRKRRAFMIAVCAGKLAQQPKNVSLEISAFP